MEKTLDEKEQLFLAKRLAELRLSIIIGDEQILPDVATRVVLEELAYVGILDEDLVEELTETKPEQKAEVQAKSLSQSGASKQKTNEITAMCNGTIVHLGETK